MNENTNLIQDSACITVNFTVSDEINVLAHANGSEYFITKHGQTVGTVTRNPSGMWISGIIGEAGVMHREFDDAIHDAIARV